MNDTSGPALLEVHEDATGEVAPDSADVHVVLTGDRFFSGSAAFEKAEELRKLASALGELGVAATALALEGVTLDVSTGLFSRSSSVTYQVRVRLQNVELLPAVLDAVAASKKATLSHLEWRYDGPSPERDALLRSAGRRAAAKATVLAESVGAKLGALHSAKEEQLEASQFSRSAGLPVGLRARASAPSVSQELAGLELAPTKRLTVRVSLAYRLLPG